MMHISKSRKGVGRMTKKQIVLRRRLTFTAAAAGLLWLLLLLFRAVLGLLSSGSGPQTMKKPRYTGVPTSVDEYINDETGRPAVEWNLMLVSEGYPLAEGYVPVLATIESRWQVDERIAGAAESMLDDCRDAGLDPIICSAFRSVDQQEALFADRIGRSKAEGLEADAAVSSAAEIVAVPGSSEHHTGLALDIVAYDYQLLDEGQEETPENQWLREHCAEYGFILRYPTGKTGETGIIYEPWHFRYVGVKAAREIMEQGITLEEYSGVVDADASPGK